MIRVITLGTFDLLHPGHLAFLQQARTFGDHLTVAVNTDAFASRYKRAPILNLDERMEALIGCRYVDDVVINIGSEDSKPAILAARASVIVHGDDWQHGSYLNQLGVTADWLRDMGVEIEYVPYTRGVSTSDIIQRCRAA